MGTGEFSGTLKHLSPPDREQLTVEAISAEAVTTSEIEGEILDPASVQSSIRRQFGLAADNRRVPAAEQGISEMMVDLYRSFAEPVSDEILFSWHRLLFKDRWGLKGYWPLSHWSRGDGCSMSRAILADEFQGLGSGVWAFR